jgi:hypothetical protein
VVVPILVRIKNLLLTEFVKVLLRELDVGSNEYQLGDLIHHTIEVFDIDYKNMDEGSTILYRYLGIEGLGDQEQSPEAQLREQVKELYVEGRSLALKGFRSGLSLGGKDSMSIIVDPNAALVH